MRRKEEFTDRFPISEYLNPSFSLCRSLEKDDLRNLGRKLTLLGEMSDRDSRDLDLLGVSSAPASSTLDTEPV